MSIPPTRVTPFADGESKFRGCNVIGVAWRGAQTWRDLPLSTITSHKDPIICRAVTSTLEIHTRNGCPQLDLSICSINESVTQWIGLREIVQNTPHISWENPWFPVFPWRNPSNDTDLPLGSCSFHHHYPEIFGAAPSAVPGYWSSKQALDWVDAAKGDVFAAPGTLIWMAQM